MKKLVIMMMVALSVFTFSAKAEAKVYTKDEAAKNLLKVIKSAADLKKDKSFKINVKTGNSSAVSKKLTTMMMKDAGVKNTVYLRMHKNESFLRDFILNFRIAKRAGKKIYVYSGIVPGTMRRTLNQMKAEAKGMNSFDRELEAANLQTNREKAWFVAKYVSTRMKNHGVNHHPTLEEFFKGNTYGMCSNIADMNMQFFLYAGLKPGECGCVVSAKNNHAWNWVDENGTRYYLNMNRTENELTERSYNNKLQIATEEEYREEDSASASIEYDVSLWRRAHNAGSAANFYCMEDKEMFCEFTGLVNSSDWIEGASAIIYLD